MSINEAAAGFTRDRDPFDRMLVAQAISENVPIVSADSALDAYSIERLW
jgi:PIN domain nuclease of toxin-antitoxin system